MRESIGKRVKLSLTAALVGTMGIVTAAPAQATELDFAPDAFDSYSLNASDWGDFDADLGDFDEYSLGNFTDSTDFTDSAYDFGLDDSLFDDNAYDFGVDLDAFSDLDEGDITIDLAEEGATDLSAYDIDPDAVSELGLDSGDFDIYDIGIDSDDLNLGTSDASIGTPPPPPHADHPIPHLSVPNVRMIRNSSDCTSYVLMGNGNLGRYTAFAFARNNPDITQYRHTEIVDIKTNCHYLNDSTAASTDAASPDAGGQPNARKAALENLEIAGAGLLGTVVGLLFATAFVAVIGGYAAGLTASQLALMSGCLAGGIGNITYVAVKEGEFDGWSPVHGLAGCVGSAITFYGIGAGYRLMDWIRNYRTGVVALTETLQLVRTAVERVITERALQHVIDVGLPEPQQRTLSTTSSMEDQWFDAAEQAVSTIGRR